MSSAWRFAREALAIASGAKIGKINLMNKKSAATGRTPPNATHAAVRLRASMSALLRQLRHAAAAEGPAGGIGTARLSVLGALYRRGPMSPSALAAHEHVRLQTLTRLLAEMEADGWIVREPHPDDGRQTLLSLSTRGVRQLTADVHRREASLARAIEATLSPARLAALVKACASIDAIADALGAHADDPLPAPRTRARAAR